MVPVTDFKEMWEFIASEIGIENIFVVDDEVEFKKKVDRIDDKALVMIATYPNSDPQNFDEDNFFDVDTTVVYILKKMAERNSDDADVMSERVETQNKMADFRRTIYELMATHDNSAPWHSILKQIMRGKQHIDRERNFQGCNGYSISLQIKTLGFDNQFYEQ